MSKSAKITLLLGVALISGAVHFSSRDTNSSRVTPGTEGRLATPKPLSDFQLMAHDLKPLNIDRLKGKWTLLFFGYTHCPDICPTTLTELAQAAQLLNPGILEDTQFVFVSVDPQRDRPESLAEYVRYFDERIIGATGSIPALETFTRQMDSKFSLEKNPAGEPIVNHSSAMLLIDPQVRYYARLKAPHYAEDIKTQYLALRNNTSATTP